MIEASGAPAQRLSVLCLGLEPYERALRLQHELVAARREARIDDTLVLLEHPSVITLGRQGDERNILVSREWLAEHEIPVFRVERGGDVAYHGPGQLVGYPIMDLRQHRTDVGWYMHSLEEVLILTLADFDIAAGRVSGNIGVWLDDRAKIAALGARIDKWITYHGFALNVAEDISPLDLIVPCGLAGKEVVSMEEVLGRQVNAAEVRARVVANFTSVFGMTARQTTLDELTGLAPS